MDSTETQDVLKQLVKDYVHLLKRIKAIRDNGLGDLEKLEENMKVLIKEQFEKHNIKVWEDDEFELKLTIADGRRSLDEEEIKKVLGVQDLEAYSKYGNPIKTLKYKEKK